MAGADYWHCDQCGAKAFYDANLNYEPSGPKRRCDSAMLPTGCGDMAALCEECAKTHEVVVRVRMITVEDLW